MQSLGSIHRRNAGEEIRTVLSTKANSHAKRRVGKLLASRGRFLSLFVVLVMLIYSSFFILPYFHSVSLESVDLLDVQSLRSSLPENEKFLLYGVTSGWSNQLIALEHALWLCRLTNRTLILPPVLSHFLRMPDSTRAGTRLSIPQIFEEIHASQPKMTQVLNMTSCTTVPTIDFSDFIQKHHLPEKFWALNHSLTGKYSDCKTTTFTHEIPRHGEIEWNQTCSGDVHQSSLVFNHSTKVHPARLPEQQTEQVWIFDFVYAWGLFDPALQNELGPMPTFYVDSVRQKAKEILTSWHPHVVAIHIRGGDYPFSNQNWDYVFPALLRYTGAVLDKHESLWKVSTNAVTFLLLTDLEGIANQNITDPLYQKWMNHEDTFWRDRKDNGKVSPDLRSTVSSGTYRKSILELQATVGEEAGVYLDQQLAACVSLGFVHVTNPSTFHARIESMRKQIPSPCL